MDKLIPFDNTRLQTLLINTGLQIKDNPTYQVINQLILSLEAINKAGGKLSASSSSSGGSSVVNSSPVVLFEDSFSDDSMTIPGPPGIDGANGMVPYHILTGEKFIVPLNKQALFDMNIDNEGDLEVDGFLIEV